MRLNPAGSKVNSCRGLVYCVIYRLLLFVSRSLNSKDVCVCVCVSDEREREADGEVLSPFASASMP